MGQPRGYASSNSEIKNRKSGSASFEIDPNADLLNPGYAYSLFGEYDISVKPRRVEVLPDGTCNIAIDFFDTPYHEEDQPSYKLSVSVLLRNDELVCIYGEAEVVNLTNEMSRFIGRETARYRNGDSEGPVIPWDQKKSDIEEGLVTGVEDRINAAFAVSPHRRNDTVFGLQTVRSVLELLISQTYKEEVWSASLTVSPYRNELSAEQIAAIEKMIPLIESKSLDYVSSGLSVTMSEQCLADFTEEVTAQKKRPEKSNTAGSVLQIDLSSMSWNVMRPADSAGSSSNIRDNQFYDEVEVTRAHPQYAVIDTADGNIQVVFALEVANLFHIKYHVADAISGKDSTNVLEHQDNGSIEVAVSMSFARGFVGRIKSLLGLDRSVTVTVTLAADAAQMSDERVREMVAEIMNEKFDQYKKSLQSAAKAHIKECAVSVLRQLKNDKTLSLEQRTLVQFAHGELEYTYDREFSPRVKIEINRPDKGDIKKLRQHWDERALTESNLVDVCEEFMATTYEENDITQLSQQIYRAYKLFGKVDVIPSEVNSTAVNFRALLEQFRDDVTAFATVKYGRVPPYPSFYPFMKNIQLINKVIEFVMGNVS